MESALPNPMGMTCERYVAACREAAVPAGNTARERYARFWRGGERRQANLHVEIPPVARTLRSESAEGQVLKFTQRVGRGAAVGGLAVLSPGPGAELETESVLIPMVGRRGMRTYTLCVSSQVGCAMGCGFCQTAQMGLLRSLSAEEITAQWFAARHMVERPDPSAAIGNIVFMGMGEPMDNLDEVIRAIGVLTDSRGPAVPMSRVTVSTVGRIDGIARLAAQVKTPGWHRLGLAVSLNAPTDDIRTRLMPVNRAMPLAKLREALLAWPIYGGAHQCLEYVLIPGVNDLSEHADAVASFVLGEAYRGPGAERHLGEPLTAMVNIIPYNPRDNSPWPAPEESAVDAFMQRIKSHGVFVKRRRTKGRETMAACGQLGNPTLRRKAARPVTAA